MDSIFKRHANISVLAGVLTLQLLGLAIQIEAPTDRGSSRLIRTWAVAALTPLEKGFVHSQQWGRSIWTNYFYLRDVRGENEQLRAEIDRMKLEQIRLQQDAAQARRIQALLAFKEEYISKTVAAQVIGSSGSEQSRVLYIDRGSDHGIQPNMAVITPDGIVGKVLRVYSSSAQVLEITDQTSGVGVILEKTRLQGILKGSVNGIAQVNYIMADEKVEPGETLITSGGDHIFPKGLPVGRVKTVTPGKGMFLDIRIDPAAELTRLEEVLVITKIEEREPDTKDLGPIRAADILAERLPSVPPKPPESAPATGQAGTGQSTTGQSPATRQPTTGQPIPAAPTAMPNTSPAGTVKKPTAAPPAASSKPSVPSALPAQLKPAPQDH
ncbi:MAG TPA: rod shape-determining protein MreC [Clostridia bacterium]|nr:rod shape-determining protein MreC [Clostridia bacterium]